MHTQAAAAATGVPLTSSAAISCLICARSVGAEKQPGQLSAMTGIVVSCAYCRVMCSRTYLPPTRISIFTKRVLYGQLQPIETEAYGTDWRAVGKRGRYESGRITRMSPASIS